MNKLIIETLKEFRKKFEHSGYCVKFNKVDKGECVCDYKYHKAFLKSSLQRVFQEGRETERKEIVEIINKFAGSGLTFTTGQLLTLKDKLLSLEKKEKDD